MIVDISTLHYTLSITMKEGKYAKKENWGA